MNAVAMFSIFIDITFVTFCHIDVEFGNSFLPRLAASLIYVIDNDEIFNTVHYL